MTKQPQRRNSINKPLRAPSGVEPLEPRILLSASLTPLEIAALEAGFGAIEEFAFDIEQSEVFNTEVSFTSRALRDVAGLSVGLDNLLSNARDYLGTASLPSFEGLADALYGEDFDPALLDGLTFDLTAGEIPIYLNVPLAGQQLSLDLSSASLTDGTLLAERVQIDSSIDAVLIDRDTDDDGVADEVSEFVLGAVLTINPDADDAVSAVSIRFPDSANRFRLIAEPIDGEDAATLDAQVGALRASVNVTGFSLDLGGARDTMGMNPTFTLGNLEDLVPSEFYEIDDSGDFLMVDADLVGMLPTLNEMDVVVETDVLSASLSFTVDDFGDEPDITLAGFDADAEAILTLGAAALTSAFEQAQTLFGELASGGPFDVEIPFTGGQTVGDVLDLGTAFGDEILSIFDRAGGDDGTFVLQDLLNDFAGALRFVPPGDHDMDGVDDPAQILFDVAFDYEFLQEQFDLVLADSIGDLGPLQLDAQTSILINAAIASRFTLGIVLEKPGARVTFDPMMTTLAELNGGTGIEFGATLATTQDDEKQDILVELRSGKSFTVDIDSLNGNSTLSALIGLFEPARALAQMNDGGTDEEWAFELKLNDDQNGLVAQNRLVAIDRSERSDGMEPAAFKISRPMFDLDGTQKFVPSLAALQFGFTSAQATEVMRDGAMVSEIGTGPLHGRTFADNIFIRRLDGAPVVSATLTLTAAGINGSASLGSLEISVADGIAQGTIVAEFSPGDPGTSGADGDITIREIQSVLPDFATQVRGTSMVQTVGEADTPYGGILTVEVDPIDPSADGAEKTVLYVPFFLIENPTSANDVSLLAAEMNLLLDLLGSGTDPIQAGSDIIKFGADEGRLTVTLTDGVARRVTLKSTTDSAELLRAASFIEQLTPILESLGTSILQLAVPTQVTAVASVLMTARGLLDDYLGQTGADIDDAIQDIQDRIADPLNDLGNMFLNQAADAILNDIVGGLNPYLESSLRMIGVPAAEADGSELSAYVARPSITSSGDLSLPVDFDFDVPGGFNIGGISLPDFSLELPTVEIVLPDLDLPDFSIPGAFSFDLGALEDFTDLLNLSDLPITAVIRAFQAGLEFLEGLEGFDGLPFLNANIPLLDINLGNILDIADVFGDLLIELERSPIAGLGMFDELFEDIIGLPENDGGLDINGDPIIFMDLPDFAVSLFPQFNVSESSPDGIEYTFTDGAGAEFTVNLADVELFEQSGPLLLADRDNPSEMRSFRTLVSFLRSDFVQGDHPTIELSLDTSDALRPALRIDTTLFIGDTSEDGQPQSPGVTVGSDVRPFDLSAGVALDLSTIAGQLGINDPVLIDAGLTGSVMLQAIAQIDLSIGIDLSILGTVASQEAEFDTFLYAFDPGMDGTELAGTSISLITSATGNVDFQTVLGPFAATATGAVTLGSNGGVFSLGDAARFSIGLRDVQDTPDGRIYFSELLDDIAGSGDFGINRFVFGGKNTGEVTLNVAFGEELGQNLSANVNAVVGFDAAALAINTTITSASDPMDLSASDLSDAILNVIEFPDATNDSLEDILNDFLTGTLSLNGLSNAWGTIFDGLQTAFDSTLFAIDLPFVGDRVRNDASSQFISSIQNALPAGISFPDNATQIVQFQSFLVGVLGFGGNNSLGWLRDISGGADAPDGLIDFRDIVVRETFRDVDGLDIFNGYEIEFSVGQRLTQSFDGSLDLGVPGLGLELDAGGDFGIEFLFDFVAGIDFQNGFFLDTTRTVAEVIVDVAPRLQAAGSLGLLSFAGAPRVPAEATLRSLGTEMSSLVIARADTGSEDGADFFRVRTREGADFGVTYDEETRALEIVVSAGTTAQGLSDLLAADDLFLPLGEGGLFSVAVEGDGAQLVDTSLSVAANGFVGIFSASLDDPSVDDDTIDPDELEDARRLTIGEIVMAGSPTDLISFDSSGSASFFLAIEANQGDFGLDIPQIIPPIAADLGFDWNFDPLADGDLAKPIVTLENVTLDLGPLFSGFIADTFAQVNSVLDPVRSITDIFAMEIPVLSELSGSPVTFFEIARLTGGEVERAVQFIEAVRDFADVVDAVNAAVQYFNDNGSLLELGGARYDFNTETFTYLGFAADVANVDPSSIDVNGAINDVEDSLNSILNGDGVTPGALTGTAAGDGGSAAGAFSASGTAGTNGEGLDLAFPVLSPTNIFAFLGGEDVTLFTLDLPKFVFGFSISKLFPLPPAPIIGIEIGGSVSAEIDLGFGYDTVGLSEFQQGAGPEVLLNGFFLSDRENADGTGKDIAELTLRGSLTAAASLDVGLASASVGGGLFATVEFNLNDPNGDGRIRGAELRDNALLEFGSFGPIHIFDVTGKLEAGLFAEFSVGIGPVAVTEYFELATIELLSFTFPRPQPSTPVLAEVIAPGILRLNMGEFAGDRADADSGLNRTDGNESFRIVGIEDSDSNPDTQVVIVEAFGYAQRFENITRVVAFAGEGDDTITVSDGFAVVLDADGGSGDDLIEGGSGDDVLRGGSGNDTIRGVAGDDVIEGGAGDDLLTGGVGHDTIRGDGGDDTILGEIGDDILLGGAGEDRVDGGRGDDELDGGADADILAGGIGNDTVRGGDGDDILDGDEGDDALDGGQGRDLVRGGAGQDSLLGGAGSDRLQGGAGIDELDGGGGDDTIEGGLGADGVLRGGSGNDDLYANTENEDEAAVGHTFVGGAGNDRIFGTVLEDVVYGDQEASSPADYTESGTDGDDLIFAFGDDNLIVSGGGNDVVEVGDGTNLIYTGSGDDVVEAGDGGNEIYAGSGDDLVTTGTGSDFIELGQGNDIARAGAGIDFVFGNSAFGLDRSALIQASSGTLGSLSIVWADVGASAVTYRSSQLVLDLAELASIRADTQTDGNDRIFGQHGTDWLFGGDGMDEIRGGAGDDYISAGAGNDIVVVGGAGDDIVLGDAGSDILHGDGGIDYIDGGAGEDSLFGDETTERSGNSWQILIGGAGNDILNAWSDGTSSVVGDFLRGDSGNDQLLGNLGADTLLGGEGNDFIHGDYLSGPDYLRNADAYRTGGADTIWGAGGEDQLYGGGSADIIWGGTGSDLIDGQGGADTLRGGSGVDVFNVVTRNTLATDADDIDGEGSDDITDEAGSIASLATDIAAAIGTTNDDVLTVAALLSEGVFPMLVFNYENIGEFNRTLQIDVVGVEQVQIVGLGGNDILGSRRGGLTDIAEFDRFALGANETTITSEFLGTNNTDFSLVVDGNSGDDVIVGSTGKDRIDGGSGSDRLYGFEGDDRLWGDGGEGFGSDIDQLFAGTGNDDLIGGQGRNVLTAWSFAPAAGAVATSGFLPGWVNDLIANGPDADFGVPADLGTPGGVREATGVNRMVGNAFDDVLFGGTGLDFLYGNDGDDTLVRSDGTLFERADGGLAGADWAAFAQETDQVWYYGGTNQNDIIQVKLVTEDGPLQGRHLILRDTVLPDGSITTDADLNLSFDNEAFLGRGLYLDVASRLAELEAIDTGDLDDRDRAELAAQINRVEADIVSSLLPPEGDFLAIIIDSLGGDDSITVDATVQKSVWVDAGAGNDVVVIQSGGGVLRDRSEDPTVSSPSGRNDTAATAFDLGTIEAPGQLFRGLTLHDPLDADYFRFTLALSGGSMEGGLAFASTLEDGTLDVEITNSDGEVVQMSGLANGEYLLRVTSLDRRVGFYDFLIGSTDSNLNTFPITDLSNQTLIERRDVVLGGDGNDRIMGGGGSEWIFGGDGNDVLMGGRDRLQSDLIFGGEGDDIFQITTDALPTVNADGQSLFSPPLPSEDVTINDQFRGGAGNDRVLILGEELTDPFGRVVGAPDVIAVRYNTLLKRYEVGSLVAIAQVNDTTNETEFSYLEDATGNRVVHYQYFQESDIEGFEVRLGDGDDIFRADSPADVDQNGSIDIAFRFNPGEEAWGFDPGDRQQGANLVDLIIAGEGGSDTLFGGIGDDLIIGDLSSADGGQQPDIIVGGLGNDRIFGNGGDDLISGGEGLPLDQVALIDAAYAGLSRISGTFPFGIVRFANPFLPVLAGPDGIDLAAAEAGAMLSFDDAFVIEGESQGSDSGEFIKRVVSIGDFDGDGVQDFLIEGEQNSYVFLSPASLDEPIDFTALLSDFNDLTTGQVRGFTDRADFVVSRQLFGKAGLSFANLNNEGAGFDDLAFIRPLASGGAEVIVVLGGSPADLPRIWTDPDAFADRARTITFSQFDLNGTGELNVEAIRSTADGSTNYQLLVTSSTTADTISFSIDNTLSEFAVDNSITAAEIAAAPKVRVGNVEYFFAEVGNGNTSIFRVDNGEVRELPSITSNARFSFSDVIELVGAGGRAWFAANAFDTFNPSEPLDRQLFTIDEAGSIVRHSLGQSALNTAIAEYFGEPITQTFTYAGPVGGQDVPEMGGLIGTDEHLYFQLSVRRIGNNDPWEGNSIILRIEAAPDGGSATSSGEMAMVAWLVPDGDVLGNGFVNFADVDYITQRAGSSETAYFVANIFDIDSSSLDSNARFALFSDPYAGGSSFVQIGLTDTITGTRLFGVEVGEDVAVGLFTIETSLLTDLSVSLQNRVPFDFDIAGLATDYQGDVIATVKPASASQNVAGQLWTFKPDFAGATDLQSGNWINYTIDDGSGIPEQDFVRDRNGVNDVFVSGENIFVTSGLGGDDPDRARLFRVSAAERGSFASANSSWNSTGISGLPGTEARLEAFLPFEGGVFVTPDDAASGGYFVGADGTEAISMGIDTPYFAFVVGDVTSSGRVDLVPIALASSGPNPDFIAGERHTTYGYVVSVNVNNGGDLIADDASYEIQQRDVTRGNVGPTFGFQAIVAGDVNNNGEDEIAFIDFSSGEEGLLVQAGADDTDRRVVIKLDAAVGNSSPALGSPEQVFRLGDINGDGFDDIAFYHADPSGPNSASLLTLLYGTNGTFTEQAWFNPSASTDLDSIGTSAVWSRGAGGNGHRYVLADASLSWEDAELQAIALGGHLVTFQSAAEEQWVIGNLLAPGGIPVASYVHIGLTDRDEEGVFRWVTGEAFDNSSRIDDGFDFNGYSNWRGMPPNGAPNNASSGQDFVSMQFANGTGSWNDINTIDRYVIEIDQSIDLQTGDFDGDGLIDLAYSASFGPNRSVEVVFDIASQMPVELNSFPTTSVTWTIEEGGNNHRYEFYDERLRTWTNAEFFGRVFGGYLATLTSQAEQSWVVDNLGILGERAHIGLTDRDVEDDFRWVTGEAFRYENWNTGEPNDFDLDDTGLGEDFVELSATGGWNDISDISLNSIYEYESFLSLESDISISGGIGARFTLLDGQNVDFNNDGIDDLVVVGTGGGSSGALYAAYGDRDRIDLEASINQDDYELVDLSNASTPGFGGTLQDENTGQSTVFSDNGRPFEIIGLARGDLPDTERWFTFRTVGDATAADRISVSASFGMINFDVFDEDGRLLTSVAQGGSSSAALPAGRYFIRVQSEAEGASFVFDIDAPLAGSDDLSRTRNDANIIYGGDGNDSIYSGSGIDEIYGNEGNDEFYAEAFQVRDAGADSGDMSNEATFGITDRPAAPQHIQFTADTREYEDLLVLEDAQFAEGDVVGFESLLSAATIPSGILIDRIEITTPSGEVVTLTTGDSYTLPRDGDYGVRFVRNTYALSAGVETWDAARAAAEAAGGRLVTIQSAAEQQWLIENLLAPGGVRVANFFHIGAVDANNNDIFSWISGEAFDNDSFVDDGDDSDGFVDWLDGQPSNSGLPDSQPIVALEFDTKAEVWGWNDRELTLQFRYITEFIGTNVFLGTLLVSDALPVLDVSTSMDPAGSGEYELVAGQSLTFDASGSTSPGGVEVISYRWVATAVSGDVISSATGPVFVLDAASPDVVTIEVFADDGDGVVSETFTVRVAAEALIALDQAGSPINEGDTLVFRATDLAGASLQAQIGIQRSFAWSVVDRDTGAELDSFTTDVAELRWQAPDDGAYSVRLRVIDDLGSEVVTGPEASFDFDASNVAPLVQVPSNGFLFEQATGQFSLALSVSDAGQTDTVSVTLISVTREDMSTIDVGTVTWLDGVLTFDAISEPGLYTVRIEASDGTDSTAYDFDLRVLNVAPVVVSVGKPQASSSGLGGRVPGSSAGETGFRDGQVVRLVANATDAGNDALTYSWTIRNERNEVVFTSAANSDAFIELVPPASGRYFVQVIVSDGELDALGSFEFNVRNAAPVLTVDPVNQLFEVGRRVTFTGRVTDFAGDTPRVLLDIGDGGPPREAIVTRDAMDPTAVTFSVSFIYRAQVIRTATLTAIDPDGATDSVSFEYGAGRIRGGMLGGTLTDGLARPPAPRPDVLRPAAASLSFEVAIDVSARTDSSNSAVKRDEVVAGARVRVPAVESSLTRSAELLRQAESILSRTEQRGEAVTFASSLADDARNGISLHEWKRVSTDNG